MIDELKPRLSTDYLPVSGVTAGLVPSEMLRPQDGPFVQLPTFCIRCCITDPEQVCVCVCVSVDQRSIIFLTGNKDN